MWEFGLVWAGNRASGNDTIPDLVRSCVEWADPGLNRGPSDFQSLALPAELSAPIYAICHDKKAGILGLSLETDPVLREASYPVFQLKNSSLFIADDFEASIT